MRCRQAHSAEQMVIMAEQDLVRRGLLKPEDVLGVVAGTRQTSGSTNLMRLHRGHQRRSRPHLAPNGEALAEASRQETAFCWPPQVIIAPYAARDTIGGRLGANP